MDVSVQAATKYIGGHADVMLGAITASETAWPVVRRTHEDLGLCTGPEDVYLALRGLRTLSVRLERHQRTGLELANWLKSRPEVESVIHPGSLKIRAMRSGAATSPALPACLRSC